MDTPLTPEFVKGMEAILSVHKTPEAILCCMQTIDKTKEPVIYLTLDCALCYIVHRSFKDVSQMAPEVEKVIDRIKKNVEEMRESSDGESDSS